MRKKLVILRFDFCILIFCLSVASCPLHATNNYISNQPNLRRNPQFSVKNVHDLPPVICVSWLVICGSSLVIPAPAFAGVNSSPRKRGAAILYKLSLYGAEWNFNFAFKIG
jgi:hypothetical protein